MSKKKRRGAPVKYPFQKTPIGSYFVVNCKDGEDPRKKQVSILTAAGRRGFIIQTSRKGGRIEVWVNGRFSSFIYPK